MLKVIKIMHKEYESSAKTYDFFAGFQYDEAENKCLVNTSNIVARARKYNDERYYTTEYRGKRVTSLDDMDLMYHDMWELKKQGYRCFVEEVDY